MKGFFYHDFFQIRKWWVPMGLAALLFGELVRRNEPYRYQLELPFVLLLLPLIAVLTGERQAGLLQLAACAPDGHRKNVQSKYALLLVSLIPSVLTSGYYAALLIPAGRQEPLVSLYITLAAVGFGLLVGEGFLFLSYLTGHPLALFWIGLITYQLRISGIVWQIRTPDSPNMSLLSRCALLLPAALILLYPSYRLTVGICRRSDY